MSEPVRLQHGHYSTYTNRGCRCEECKEAWSDYQSGYWRKRNPVPSEAGTKRQPKLDEMMKAIDREPRSDLAVERRNRQLHEDKTKKKCSHPACKSNLNRWQLKKGLCMRHESEMARERMAAKLRKLERV